MLNNLFKVGWKLKDADVMCYMLTSLISLQQEGGCRTSLVSTTSLLTRKCQKTRKIDEKINIERENLQIFWTTWGTLMKFSGKILIVTKKQGFTFSVENFKSCNYYCKSYNYCQNLKWEFSFFMLMFKFMYALFQFRVI